MAVDRDRINKLRDKLTTALDRTQKKLADLMNPNVKSLQSYPTYFQSDTHVGQIKFLESEIIRIEAEIELLREYEDALTNDKYVLIERQLSGHCEECGGTRGGFSHSMFCTNHPIYKLPAPEAFTE